MSNNFIVKCCYCDKVKNENNQWVSRKELHTTATHVSHGICDSCFQEYFAKRAYNFGNKSLNKEKHKKYKSNLAYKCI